jgi:UDP-2,4-diacetamido-2,4,6-trideoxy-beta-L-altropyranose hydrolase
LIRCLALSEELTSKGKQCYLFSKTSTDHLIQKVNKYDIQNHRVNSDLPLNKELKQLISFSNKNNVEWIITDCYDINADYLKTLKREGFRILSIDDTAHIHYTSDIVLNQNVGAEKLTFSAEKYTRFLLGPKYVMIRNQLLRKNVKRLNREVKTILILFGGSDYCNITLKTIKSLVTINEDVRLLVVIGPINSHYKQIKEYIKNIERRIDLIVSPQDMGDIYQRTDIALTAGGSTCYELAFFGIPSLIISVADNQISIAKELDRQQLGIYLGNKNMVHGKQIKSSVEELAISQKLRKRMSINGKKLVDGKGKIRIVDFMERFT